MPRGNEREGLLAHMLEIMKRQPAGCRGLTDLGMVEELQKNYSQWNDGEAATPENTVRSYFSENPHIFYSSGRNPTFYYLKREYDNLPPE
jgi:hypothetical protein